MCNILGIDADKLPQILHSDEIVGNVKEEVASRVGLSDKTAVIAGVMDSVAACISLGVTDTKKPALIIGTVARLCLPSEKDYFDNRFLNTFYLKDIPYLIMTPVNGGGLSIRWFIENFCIDEINKAKEQKIDFYKLIEEKIKDIPPGSNSLIYLPYLVGERSPIWNPKARGMFFGISHNHTKYHFYRSIMEGVAFAIRHNLEIYKETYDVDIDYITISGGGARSRLWSSIISDILSIKVAIPEAVETETKGSAVLAGLGVGLFSSLNNALTREDNLYLIRPNPDNKKRYDLMFSIYKNLYKHCLDDYSDLYSINI